MSATENGGSRQHDVSGTGARPELGEVRRLDLPEAHELARLSAAFEDLQHVLRCCEHLVTAIGVTVIGAPAGGAARGPADGAVVEALWTSALLSYSRCFSMEPPVLSTAELDALELPGDVSGFHRALLRLRDHYASGQVNPRETISVGAADHDGEPVGVAVVSAPAPSVDDTSVRQLGAIAYRLSGLMDARMREVQDRVLDAARRLGEEEFAALPLVPLDA